jgi:asparagine synthase (glutamine-hydrolysing)
MVSFHGSCLFPSSLLSLIQRQGGRVEREGAVPGLFPLEGDPPPAMQALLTALLSPTESALRDGNLFHAFESAYGLEYRHPFFDRTLVEFILSLPPEFLHSRGWSKALLRYAMEGMLPPAIQSRRDKADFLPVLALQLRAMEWRPLLEDSYLVALGLADRERLERAAQAYFAGEEGWSPLWDFVQVESWYRRTFC